MKLAFKSKNQIVHTALLDAIIRGEFKPEQRLVIDDLAAQMGVSQIPIREALRQLEADGFVLFRPHIGFTVAPIHAGLIAEVFALLEATEVFSSRAACQLMTDADLAQLESMIQSMGSSVETPSQWTQANKALHQFICECSRTTLIMAAMNNALDHWDRLQTHYFTNVLANRIRQAQKEHERILVAFCTRDPDAVERAIREHNRSARLAYLLQMEAVQP